MKNNPRKKSLPNKKLIEEKDSEGIQETFYLSNIPGLVQSIKNEMNKPLIVSEKISDIFDDQILEEIDHQGHSGKTLKLKIKDL